MKGVTAVDCKYQAIVAAEAYDQANESNFLEPQVAYFQGRTEQGKRSSFSEKMKRKIDSSTGQAIYSMRLAVSEPPFAHLRLIIGLDRFTLRTRKKVDTQWKLFCIIHNLQKVHRYGVGFS